MRNCLFVPIWNLETVSGGPSVDSSGLEGTQQINKSEMYLGAGPIKVVKVSS